MTVAIIDNRGTRPVFIGAGAQVAGALVAESRTLRDAAETARGLAVSARVAAELARDAAIAGASSSGYRPTLAAGITDFLVGQFFTSDDQGAVSAHPNQLRLYKRIASSPFYQDQGDEASPVSRSLLAAPNGYERIGTPDGRLDQVLASITKRFENKLSIREDFGAKGDGTDDTAAFNAAIAYINANGSASATANISFEIEVGPGEYNLKASDLDPILVSNVAWNFSPSAILLMRDRPLFRLGSATVFVERHVFQGGQPTVEAGDTPNASSAFVWIENAARLFVSDQYLYRCARLVGCDLQPGCIAANIIVRRPFNHGLPDFNLIDIKNTIGGIGAGIWLDDPSLYAFAPPANPAIVPQNITGITKANPGVVTSANHGLTTGDKVRLMLVQGMTQVNKQDYTVTVIDANTFSIGVNTSSFGTYTGGGCFAELHWSNGYNSAVVSIEGQWDTAIMFNGLCQHYRHFCKVKSNGLGGAPISFLDISPKYWDYGGAELLDMELAGASIADVYVHDVWHFALEGKVFGLRRTSGSNFVIGFRVSQMRIGLAGEGVITDPSGLLVRPKFTDIDITALCRTDCGDFSLNINYAFLFQGTSGEPFLNNIRCENPDNSYGPGAAARLLPSSSFYSVHGSNAVTMTNCLWNDLGGGLADVTEGTATHVLSGNRAFNGQLLGYLAKRLPTVGPSPFTWVNRTGSVVNVAVRGGVVSIASISQFGSNITVAGSTNFAVVVGRDQALTITYSSPPTFEVGPINI